MRLHCLAKLQNSYHCFQWGMARHGIALKVSESFLMNLTVMHSKPVLSLVVVKICWTTVYFHWHFACTASAILR